MSSPLRLSPLQFDSLREKQKRRKRRNLSNSKTRPRADAEPRRRPVIPLIELPLLENDDDDHKIASSSSSVPAREEKPPVERSFITQSKSVYAFSSLKNASFLPNRYHIMETIVSGCFGSVYRCFDYNTSQFVAIKEQKIKTRIDSAFSTPRGFHECTVVRFINEPESKKRDKGSRFVIEFLEEFTSPAKDSYYLVTPYYIRGDLLDFAEGFRETINYEQEVKDISRDILFGLRYLHGIGVAHRDIKPENVFIHYDVGLRRVSARIADFGLSAIVDNHSYEFNDNPGTALYAAPEQFFKSNYGRSNLKALDIWSFAATVFAIVYGVFAFVKPGVKVEDTREFYSHLVGNIVNYNSNHLKIDVPPLFSESVIEIFELCFVSNIERPTAAQLLHCSWFRSIPSVQSVFASATASTEDLLDSATFNYLNGYDPARQEETIVLQLVHASTKKKSRFRVSNNIFNWASRKQKE